MFLSRLAPDPDSLNSFIAVTGLNPETNKEGYVPERLPSKTTKEMNKIIFPGVKILLVVIFLPAKELYTGVIRSINRMDIAAEINVVRNDSLWNWFTICILNAPEI